MPSYAIYIVNAPEDIPVHSESAASFYCNSNFRGQERKKMTKYKLFLKYDSVRQKFCKQRLKPNDKQEKIYLEL